ncbi:MAG: prepilin-type N-terminal cleavage/methylation domain-containing protein [Nitrospirota bacterium]
MLNRIRDQKGFTLLEMLVAGTILAVGLLGIASMMVSAMQGNNYARRVSIATNLAQQKIEEMKNIPFENLYATDPNNSNKSSNAAPANMNNLSGTHVEGDPYSCDTVYTHTDGHCVKALDGGSNPSPCNATYPCGDVTSGDKVWTYSLSYTDPDTGIVFRRIWTVKRNPDIDGDNSLASDGTNTDADEQRTIRVEAIVSWNNSKDVAPVKWHKITTASIIAG